MTSPAILSGMQEGTVTTTNPFTVPYPGTVVLGAPMFIVLVSLAGGNTCTTPSGWTLLAPVVVNASFNVWVFGKQATSGDVLAAGSGTIGFTLDSQFTTGYLVFAYDSGTIGAISTNTTGFSQAWLGTSIIAGATGATLIAIAQSNSGSDDPTADAAMTQRSTGNNLMVMDQALVASGATGTRGALITGGNFVSGTEAVMILVEPSGGGGGGTPDPGFTPRAKVRVGGLFKNSIVPKQRAIQLPILGYGILSQPFVFIPTIPVSFAPQPPPQAFNAGPARIAGPPPNLLGSGLLRATQPAPNALPPAVVGVLRTQQRALGFPPTAPIPGIPLLGIGFLKGQTSPSTNTTTVVSWSPQADGSFVTITIISSGFGSTPQATMSSFGAETASSVFSLSPLATSVVVGSELAAVSFSGTPDSLANVVGSETVASVITSAPIAGSSVVGAEISTSPFSSTPTSILAATGSSTDASVLTSAPVANLSISSGGSSATIMSSAPTATVTIVGAETTASTVVSTPQAATSITGAETNYAAVSATPNAAVSISDSSTASGVVTSSPVANTLLAGSERVTSVLTSAPQTTTSILTSGGVGGSMSVTPQANASVSGAETSATQLTVAPSAVPSVTAGQVDASVMAPDPGALLLMGASEMAISTLSSTPQSAASFASVSGTGGVMAATPGSTLSFNNIRLTACTLMVAPDTSVAFSASVRLASVFTSGAAGSFVPSTIVPFHPSVRNRSSVLFECRQSSRQSVILECTTSGLD